LSLKSVVLIQFTYTLKLCPIYRLLAVTIRVCTSDVLNQPYIVRLFKQPDWLYLQVMTLRIYTVSETLNQNDPVYSACHSKCHIDVPVRILANTDIQMDLYNIYPFDM